MMLRSLMIIPVLAIGLAMPVAAQQISDQEARKVVESLVERFDNAMRTKDVAGSTAIFTEDAIRVTPDGPLVGRAAIEKDFAEGFKVYSHDASKGNQVMVVNGLIFANGSWGGTLQGPNGPMQIKGYWGHTEVPDGGTWKMRFDAFNMTPTPPSSTVE